MTYSEVSAELQAAHPDVEAGKMFGMPVLKNGRGKVLGGEWKGDMTFKLVDAAVREQALKIDGAEQFDPGMGRPMKEWVVVPAAAADQWPKLAEAAYEGMENA